MLDVGIIGLGPDWETTYLPALHRLSDRLRVRAVYDAVASRAKHAAAEFHATTCHGIHCTSTNLAVKAVLVLGDAWYREALFSFLIGHNRPAFVAEIATFLHTPSLDQVTTAETPVPMIVPGLTRRYTPATGRLRELMATRLGAATNIDVRLCSPHTGSETETMLSLIDWCRYLVGTPALSRPSPGHSLLLEFPPARSHASTATARIAVADAVADAEQSAEFTATVTCERGSAVIEGTKQITWTHAGEQRSETLEGEREAAVVLLDLFCRRVLGGLIPTPTAEDLFLSAKLAKFE